MSAAIRAVGVVPAAGVQARRRIRRAGLGHGQFLGQKASRRVSTASAWDGETGMSSAEVVQTCTRWLSDAGVTVQNHVSA